MTITAKVIEHSRVSGSPDLITIQARYPRFIHAEAKTHRLLRIDDAEYEFLQEISLMDDENLSRNASSSRAIPIQRMIDDVLDDPALPVAWGSNKPGMQAGPEIDIPVQIFDPRHGVGNYWAEPEHAWLVARDRMVEIARAYADAGYHKQVVNRLLEPFGHISVVITATEWQNFFDLRRHADADPTMRALADAIHDAITLSEAYEPEINDSSIFWHLPYTDGETVDQVINLVTKDYDKLRDLAHDVPPTMLRIEQVLALVSAARCARVSYLNHDGTSPDIEKDLKLASMLLQSRHMSPFEHQARGWVTGVHKPHLQGNLTGWSQFRKILELNL